jgi:hypothetical protein
MGSYRDPLFWPCFFTAIGTMMLSVIVTGVVAEFTKPESFMHFWYGDSATYEPEPKCPRCWDAPVLIPEFGAICEPCSNDLILKVWEAETRGNQ